MRIAQIAPPWFTVPPARYGGTERVVALLCDGLVARGHDVTLVASGGSHTAARLVSPLSEPPEPRDLGNEWDDIFHTATAYRSLGEVDVIHDHSGVLGPVLGAAARRGVGGAPIVHTIHGGWTRRSRRHYRMIHHEVELVAISDAQRRAQPDISIGAVVHNGLDPAHFPFRADKEDRLVFLGRCSADKGPVEAIEVAARTGLPLDMLIKVNEPDEIEYWENAVVPRLHRGVNVIVNADHEQSVGALGAAMALVSPLRWEEPFGLVMIEAMACGTPVLVCPRGAAPEVISHGVTGWLTDPSDPVESTIAALGKVHDLDPAACRERVLEHFTHDVMVDAYVAVYEQALR